MGLTTQSLAVIALAWSLGGNVSGGLFSGRPATTQAAPEEAVSGWDLAEAVKQLQTTVCVQRVQQECGSLAR